MLLALAGCAAPSFEMQLWGELGNVLLRLLGEACAERGVSNTVAGAGTQLRCSAFLGCAVLVMVDLLRSALGAWALQRDSARCHAHPNSAQARSPPQSPAAVLWASPSAWLLSLRLDFALAETGGDRF